jgi:hypothetical protein
LPIRAARERRTELRSSSSLQTSSVNTTQTRAPVSKVAGPDTLATAEFDAAAATAVIDMVSKPTDIEMRALLVIFMPFANNWL